ncbi:hypothetical protein BST12_28115 [Mycobacterium angelicum]|uniref:Uncharacterized protein n=1 Tax=Mycobacterium angelicum TaxID=470074 RepID=A0A1W9Z7T1_MYCAN|nr:hypothetical protein BST12_28115 [Mycobacterium angelicum]
MTVDAAGGVDSNGLVGPVGFTAVQGPILNSPNEGRYPDCAPLTCLSGYRHILVIPKVRSRLLPLVSPRFAVGAAAPHARAPLTHGDVGKTDL